MDNEADYEKLDSRIEELIRKRWGEGRPLLLSQLGSQDDGEVAKLAKSKMGSLGAYLRTRLSTKVKILRHSTRPVVVGVVPSDANIPEAGADTDRLLDETVGSGGRRYNAALGSLQEAPRIYIATLSRQTAHALQRPDGEEILGAGYTEIVRTFIASSDADDTKVEESIHGYVKRPMHFKDTDGEEILGAGYTEIVRTFIASSDADDTKVEESIHGWIDSKGIDAQTFYQSAHETTLPHDDAARPSVNHTRCR